MKKKVHNIETIFYHDFDDTTIIDKYINDYELLEDSISYIGLKESDYEYDLPDSSDYLLYNQILELFDVSGLDKVMLII